MTIVDDPETLYHYCSFKSFLGIVNNSELWASDFRFMNDSRDFRHGIDVFRKVTSSENIADSASLQLLTRKILQLVEAEDSCVYVASLSARSDDNSQWSRYAHENGVAIGFNRLRLERLFQDAFFDFGRVEYNLKRQADVIGDFVNRFFKLYGAATLTSEDINRISLARLSNLVPFIATCKDPAFVTECEWRASAFTVASASRERFRATTQGLVPYVAIKLIDSSSESLDGLFNEIVVGPGRFCDENTAVTARFLKSKRIRCAVTKSTSTLRF
jgi:Protein of unknown function (DUF2971)